MALTGSFTARPEADSWDFFHKCLEVPQFLGLLVAKPKIPESHYPQCLAVMVRRCLSKIQNSTRSSLRLEVFTKKWLFVTGAVSQNDQRVGPTLGFRTKETQFYFDVFFGLNSALFRSWPASPEKTFMNVNDEKVRITHWSRIRCVFSRGSYDYHWWTGCILRSTLAHLALHGQKTMAPLGF